MNRVMEELESAGPPWVTFRPQDQVWCCKLCGVPRAWGTGRPWDDVVKRLLCAYCRTVTPHSFWKVA